jgi:hypothetical protein
MFAGLHLAAINYSKSPNSQKPGAINTGFLEILFNAQAALL